VFRRGLSIPGSLPYREKHLLEVYTMSGVITPQTPLTKGVYQDGWVAFNIGHVKAHDSAKSTITLEVTDSFNLIHTSTPTELVIHYADFSSLGF
jgi:hypothetical protein